MSNSDKPKPTHSQLLYGLDTRDIDFDCFEKPIHSDVRKALLALKMRAKSAGYALSLASGYRSFEQQLNIWNAKASGQRVVLDSQEHPVDITDLSSIERVHAILRWSALPGASRHHWGSEVDIFDAAALNAETPLQLTRAETEAGGVFEHFYVWLNRELEDMSDIFFRPYAQDLGGVAPEPWHLSYRPLADRFQAMHSIDALGTLIAQSDMRLKDTVLASLDDIYARYFTKIKN